MNKSEEVKVDDMEEDKEREGVSEHDEHKEIQGVKDVNEGVKETEAYENSPKLTTVNKEEDKGSNRAVVRESNKEPVTMFETKMTPEEMKQDIRPQVITREKPRDQNMNKDIGMLLSFEGELNKKTSSVINPEAHELESKNTVYRESALDSDDRTSNINKLVEDTELVSEKRKSNRKERTEKSNTNKNNPVTRLELPERSSDIDNLIKSLNSKRDAFVEQYTPSKHEKSENQSIRKVISEAKFNFYRI